MPFTDRQNDALRRMGMVPWVRRNAPALCPAAQPASNGACETGAAFTGLPSDHWVHCLPDYCKISPWATEPAQVEILLELAPEYADGGLPKAQANLLDAMCRAINLLPREFRVQGRTHSLPEQGRSGQMAQSIAHCLHDDSRAVLVFSQAVFSQHAPDWIDTQSAVSLSGAASRRIPVFYLPYVQRLLDEPGLKRIAWEVLKHVRRQLHSSSSAGVADS